MEQLQLKRLLARSTRSTTHTTTRFGSAFCGRSFSAAPSRLLSPLQVNRVAAARMHVSNPPAAPSPPALQRIAISTPHSAGSYAHDVVTPASSGSSVKLTPSSGSCRKTLPAAGSSEHAGTSTLASPEDLLAEERRKHARTRELLEAQTSALADSERELLLLRAELRAARARPDRRRWHRS